jgi:hypothetical protein
LRYVGQCLDTPRPSADLFSFGADLEALLLSRTLSAATVSLDIPFRLKRLCVADVDYAEGLLASLCAASADTLTSFTIAIGASNSATQAALVAFEIIAPRVEDAGIWWRGDDANSLDLSSTLSTCPDLRRCTSLTSLRLIHHPHPPRFLSSLLSTIPSTLRHLESFSSPRSTVSEDYQRSLALPALKELEEWSVVDPKDWLRNLEDTRAWCSFAEACTKRKINLECRGRRAR